jgi:hypothetical protein
MKLIYTLLFLSIIQLISAQSRHTISIQSGLFHTYFDQTPLFNFNNTSKDEGIFHGVHLGSVGIDYAYQINPKNSVAVEYTRLVNNYKEIWADHRMGDVCSRDLRTLYLKYQRRNSIFKKTSLIYGTGVSFRYGETYLFTSSWHYTHSYNERNLALNAFVGLDHQLTNRLSAFYKFDLRSVLYYVNHEELNEYPQFHPNYPNRFDLSLKVGLSFHF